MKTATMIARILLGLTFLVFGLNGLFQFIKLPPPSGVALQFLGALVVSHESVVIMGLQVLAGAFLLLNRYVPLALFVLAPIVLNILFFHFFMDPGGIPRALFVLVLWVVAALGFPEMFVVLFRAKPSQAE
jgi:putative oxidoreductase